VKKIRINKFLAQCGIGSRRSVEELIKKGSVIVNGSVRKDLALSVDPHEDTVLVHGKKVSLPTDHLYLMMNKPKGYLTTLSDDRGRKTVMELIPHKFLRRGVFPVGRLDKDTEGLLLFTTDGNLANQLSRPESKVEKIYMAVVNKPLTEDHYRRLSRGVYVEELKITTRFSQITKVGHDGTSWKVSLSEGKKRQVRYLFLALGIRVKHLERISYGPLTITGTDKGDIRKLKKNEVEMLKKAIRKPK
jgi:23S rRNA pseudouridine2605 synthase